MWLFYQKGYTGKWYINKSVNKPGGSRVGGKALPMTTPIKLSESEAGESFAALQLRYPPPKDDDNE